MTSLNGDVDLFFQGSIYAVGGASQRRHKYGNQIFRALQRQHWKVYPLNPVVESVEGVLAFKSLEALPEVPNSLCIVTPPLVTLELVKSAIKLGVDSLWIQPGAQHPDAGLLARASGLNVIDDGRCLLIELGQSKL